MSKSIPCNDIYGKQVEVPVEKIAFRPTVYGIVLHEGKILLCNTRSTGKYSLPGGGIDLGEKVEDALHREVYEECGISIDVDRLAGVDENFCYYNPGDEAWQVIAIFYICTPKTFELSTPDEHELEAEKPQWIPIKNLTAEQFQIFGKTAMKVLSTIS